MNKRFALFLIALACTAVTIVAMPESASTGGSVSAYFSNLVQTTQSLPLRLLLVFILGVLLSFTPCIYPMIPITIGILQAQGSVSFFRNFLLALSYACGIATTFALLGLLAATTGQLFGSLLSHPVFVLAVVALLAYLAGSMLGFYEMYTPRFLQQQPGRQHSGSFFSAFAFGAVSGTFASPCVSPGLVLLLSIVTTIGSQFIGFLLLFMFGIGLSMPLLIVGTFSSSLNMLPRAGMWMVVLKEFFGLIMVGMCFYFLAMVFPQYVIFALLAVTCAFSGAWLLYGTHKNKEQPFIWAKRLLALALLIAVLPISFVVYQDRCCQEVQTAGHWLTDYEQALGQARAEGKHLFIDFGAPFCSLCKLIEKKLLHDPAVEKALQNFVLLKVDAADTAHPHNAALVKRYDIVGVPVILIVDAQTGAALARYGGELLQVDKAEFVRGLESRR